MGDRTWHPKHLQTDSDTDSTDDDHHVGGLGKYSHKDTGLSHQHWGAQLKSAGCFNVHCTQASEASHKTNMRLASLRVRHLRHNITQASMQDYLCLNTLFENVKILHKRASRVMGTRPRVKVSGLHMPLTDVRMGADLASTVAQRQFLHPEIR